jgi:hypothetical protein
MYASHVATTTVPLLAHLVLVPADRSRRDQVTLFSIYASFLLIMVVTIYAKGIREAHVSRAPKRNKKKKK